MFDFDKNEYHVRETGRDFWGNRKYEIIEKPKGGGCVGIIIVIALLFYLAKGCNGNSSADTDEGIERTQDTGEELVDETNVSEHQNDNQNGSSSSDEETNESNPPYEEDVKSEADQNTPESESQIIVLKESPLESDQNEEEKTEIENDQITDDKVMELFDKYSTSDSDSNKKDIIKMISEELNISKHKVKNILKKSGKL